RVTGATGFHRIGANHAWTRITVNHLISENLWQQFTFVDRDAGGGAIACLQQVRHHTRIVLMEMIEWPFVLACAFGLGFLPASAPTLAGRLVGEPVVAELHHEVDAYSTITVVVIVRLPDAAEG